MAINGKNQIYFSKKDLTTQKTIATGFKKIKFYHQASEDDTQIDLLSLTLPSSGIPVSATNPGASDLSSAKLLFNRNNILLMSSLSGLLDFDSYSIISNTVIELATPAADGEIFIGIIDHVARTGLRTVDTDPIVVTGTLAAGDTEFIVGKPFDLNKYPTTQQGALLVFLDGQLMARNVGNALADPGADGDYQEVGVGSIGSSIEFNNSDPSDRSVMIVNSGLMATAPNESILAQIENIAGQVDNMIPTLAALAGVDETTFQTAPNSVDLQNFGQRMLAAEADIDAAQADIDAAQADLTALGEGGDASANGPLLATDSVAGASTRLHAIALQGLNTTIMSTGTNSYTRLDFPNASANGIIWDGILFEATISVDGLYMLGLVADRVNGQAGRRGFVYAGLNGNDTSFLLDGGANSLASQNDVFSGTVCVELSAGDIIHFVYRQNDSSSPGVTINTSGTRAFITQVR